MGEKEKKEKKRKRSKSEKKEKKEKKKEKKREKKDTDLEIANDSNDDNTKLENEEEPTKREDDSLINKDQEQQQQTQDELNNVSKDENEKNEDENENEGDEPTKRKRKRKRKKKSNPAGDSNQETQGSGDNNNTEKLTSIDHTVFVEGIPFDSSEDDVRKFFVDNSCDDVIQMRLPRWQDTGRLRGFGHIVFNTTESREKAISELNGKNLGKRYLSIKAPNPPRAGTSAGATMGNKARDQPEGCSKIFVRNLPYDATEDDIHTAFVSCGKIVDGGVRLARNYSTQQSKGFGYVEFKNPEGAFAAVNRAAKPFGIVLSGRPCFVDYDEKNMKGSFRTTDGKLWQKQHGSVHSNR